MGEEARQAGEELTLPLAAVGEGDRARVGGKALGLARLARAGLPVPPGFCVTAAAYRAHARAAGIAERLAALEGNGRRELLTAIRRGIEETPPCPRLRAEILRQLSSLGPVRVAVRSSATAEDLPGHSFAGQHDTHLGVAGADDCVRAVVRCWASLWGERAVDYRLHRGFAVAASEMAVVVQALVSADSSGVLFTVDPVDGRTDRVVLEGAFGLGESVVSGRVSPDRFVLAKDGLRSLERRIESKQIEVRLGEDGRVEERLLSGARAVAPCLDEAIARRLAGLALEAERSLGGPLDLEWAVRDGEPFFLQSRPVTAIRAPRSEEDRQVWTNMNAGEVLPGVVSPMIWSGIAPVMRTVFTAVLARLGLDLTGRPLLERIAGRVYFNLNTLVGLARNLPGFRDRDLIEALGGMQGRLQDAGRLRITPEDAPPIPIAWTRALLRAPGTLLWLVDHLPARALARTREWRRESEGLERMDRRGFSDDEALRHALHIFGHPETFCDAIADAGMGMAWFGLLRLVCERWLGDADLSLFNALLAGTGEMASAESALDLWRLARRAHASPSVAARLGSGVAWADLAGELETLPGGPSFRAAWDRFHADHGHHTHAEIDVRTPRWRETPDAMLAIVRGYLREIGSVDPEAHHRRRGRESAAQAEACARRLGGLRARLFRGILARAQRGCLMRENVKSEAVRRLGTVRGFLLEVGRRLAERGRIDREEDVFYLHGDELEPALLGRAGFDPRVAVAARRAEEERNLALDPPPVVVGRYDPARHRTEAAVPGARILTGLAVSPGVVTAPARVILRAQDGDALRPGEILVAPFTDPGWTPCFLHAAGIVMDMGGMLSHGSIVAREYGIPCVVNVGPATRVVRDGQSITVDGNRGVVELNPAAGTSGSSRTA